MENVKHLCAISYKDVKHLMPKPMFVGTKGLVINYGEGGATKWENHGSETFCAPPPFKEWKLFVTPLQYG